MSPQQLLPISVAILALLGTLPLGMAQQNFTRTGLMLLAATGSILVTDVKPYFRLQPAVASIAALLAAGFCVYQVQGANRDDQLVAIANLLIYLQIILLFQKKNSRVYWQLLLMSLLQVVVAAATNLSFWFGLLLVVYLIVVLVVLTLFLISRETDAYLTVSRSGEELATSPIPGPPKPLGQSYLRSAVSRLSGLQLCQMLVRTTATMSLVTLLLTILFFLVMPRFGNSPWQANFAAKQRMTGFSKLVRLGELGPVLKSPRLVMRISFSDQKTSRGFQPVDTPFLQGTIVTRYNHLTQMWSQSSSQLNSPKISLPLAAPVNQVTEQEILLEPYSTKILFSVFPPCRLPSLTPVQLDLHGQQLVLTTPPQQNRVHTVIGTTGFANRRQHPITPQMFPLSAEDRERLLTMTVCQTDTWLFPGLDRVATSVVKEANVPQEDRLLVARTLSAFLHHQGGFVYTLEPQPLEPDLDPLENFVVHHRRGHCEYFAGALCLMLRSQQIPARVVIGFKAEDWNPMGHYYRIEQQHAHTWVEAFLEPEDLENRNLLASRSAPHGAWLRLDPTTGNSSTPGGGRPAMLANVGDAVDYAKLLWNHYILGMDRQRQQRNIYDPLGQAIMETVRGVFQESLWPAPLRKPAITARTVIWNWLHGNWFSWRGGLLAVFYCLILVASHQVGRFVWNQLQHKGFARRQRFRTRQRPEIEFYRRLECLLRRHGMIRATGQTPYEFATASGGSLAQSKRLRPAANVPRHVVEAFYRVRFGGEQLDQKESTTIDNRLDQLDQLLQQNRR